MTASQQYFMIVFETKSQVLLRFLICMLDVFVTV